MLWTIVQLPSNPQISDRRLSNICGCGVVERSDHRCADDHVISFVEWFVSTSSIKDPTKLSWTRTILVSPVMNSGRHGPPVQPGYAHSCCQSRNSCIASLTEDLNRERCIWRAGYATMQIPPLKRNWFVADWGLAAGLPVDWFEPSRKKSYPRIHKRYI